MMFDQQTPTLERTTPPENAGQRRSRRKMLRGWATMSVIGFAVVVAVSAYAASQLGRDSIAGITSVAVTTSNPFLVSSF